MENKLVRIVLGGILGKKFGKEWHLNVSSPTEAIRAIDANTKGEFRRYLMEGNGKKLYKIAIQNKNNLLGKEELNNPSGNSDIYILPVVAGKNGKGGGIGKILAAIAIIAITYFTVGAGSTAFAVLSEAGQQAAVATLASYATIGYSIGASLLLSGIAQLLTPVPKFSTSTTDGRGSSIFQGNATAISQGSAVGLVYGRALVAPMPISISFDNIDQSSTTSTSSGGGGGLGGPEGSLGNGYVYTYLDIFTGANGDVTWNPVTPPEYKSAS